MGATITSMNVWGWRVMVSAIVGAIAVIAGLATFEFASREARWTTVGAVEDVRAGEPLFSGDTSVYVVEKRDGDVRALYARGPWRQERVAFCKTSRLFEGTLSGSKFDIYGHYYGGPAPRGMTRLPVRVEGTQVQVLLDDPIEGPPRDSGALEPQGAFCSV